MAGKRAVTGLLVAWLQPGLERWEKEKEKLPEIISEHQVFGEDNVFGAL